MKEWLLQGAGLYVLSGVCLVGIAERYVVWACLRHMLLQLDKGTNSKSRTMHQIKNIFESTYRINNELPYMEAFTWKQVFQLRFGGLKLHSWRVLSNETFVLQAIVSGALCLYCWQLGNAMLAWRYAIFGCALLTFMLLFYVWTDLDHKERELQIGLEDYLGNTCLSHLLRGAKREARDGVSEKEENSRGGFVNQAPQDSKSLPDEEIAAAKEMKKEESFVGKKNQGKSKRVLTEEESRLIEEILKEYLS